MMRLYQKQLKQQVQEKTQALSESESKYRNLIENIPDITWTLDGMFHLAFMSSNVEKLMGYPAEEFYGEDNLWLKNIHPEDVENVIHGYFELFKDSKPYDIEYRVKAKNEDWIWVNDRATHTYDKNGVKYADGIATVITEKKKNEERVKELLKRNRKCD